MRIAPAAATIPTPSPTIRSRCWRWPRASGLGGMDAPMAYVDGVGSVQSASLLGQTWSGPAPVGGTSCTHVALATHRAW